MSTTALRIERFPASEPAPKPFAALGERMNGVPDSDPVPEEGERWLALRGDDAVARLSTSTATDLREAPGVSGLVGHYEAADPLAGSVLLTGACDALVEQGVRRVIGPINGNTWRRYRLALPGLAGDPVFTPSTFFSEPRNPPEYPVEFETVRFKPLAYYESRIESPIVPDDAARREAWERLQRHGTVVRSLDLSRFDDELRLLWELSLASFADNAFYTPIEFDEFAALYKPMRKHIDADLVLLAHDPEGRLVGFMLGFPDLMSDLGKGPTRLVVKTLAVAPEWRGRGLGGFLMAELRARAARKGYQAAIDALIHLSNLSRRISQKFGTKVFRRYALYQWTP